MNIYMTGSHGTGKTTTAEIVSGITDLGLLPSASRMSPHKQGTVEHQQYVMGQVYNRCLKYDGIIHERTPLDVFAYTSVRNLNSVRNEQVMKLQNFFRVISYYGDVLFYFPILFQLEDDGFRPDQDEQVAIDDLIYDVLERERVNYKVVPKGAPEKRAAFILKESGYAEL